MKKEQIANQAHKMKTKEDLLSLLNQIKLDDAVEKGYANMFKPFTIQQINFYCNPNHTKHRYTQFKIKKKTPGEFRTITAPRKGVFRLLLQYMNVILKSIYTPSDSAMGFVEGRCVVTNAEKHKGMNYILNIDLKDFFPSISRARVWKRIQVKPLCISESVSGVIAGFCTMKETRTMEDGTQKDFYVLPQGAPTSPIITNMICDRLDYLLNALANRFGINYSRYADDITFSSMHNVYQEDGEFRKELLRIITDQGFRMNDKKTRLQKRGCHQEVTGIVVSDKLNVTQKYVRDIRNLLYIWKKHGLGVAECVFMPKYKQEKGHVKKGTPNLIHVLEGKLLYLKMVKGEEDSVYKRLKTQYDALLKSILSPENQTNQKITYIETLSLSDFEKKTGSDVTLVCEDNKKFGMLSLKGNKILASINKSVTSQELSSKESLAISLCIDSEGKQFWLIHKKDKITVPTPKSVDIDKLNDELDTLLNI